MITIMHMDKFHIQSKITPRIHPYVEILNHGCVCQNIVNRYGQDLTQPPIS